MPTSQNPTLVLELTLTLLLNFLMIGNYLFKDFFHRSYTHKRKCSKFTLAPANFQCNTCCIVYADSASL